MIKTSNFNSFFNLRLLHFILCIILFCNGLAQKNDSINEAVTYSYDTLAQKTYINSIPWRNSPFVFVSVSFPSTILIELGQNIGSYISLGLTCSGYDEWSNKSKKAKIGIFTTVKIPFYKLPITPYVSINIAQSEIFKKKDKYVQFNIGSIIKIFPWLNFRSEINFAQIEKYLEGGKNMYGYGPPETSETKNRIAISTGIELNLKGFFKKHRKIKN